jgi:HrpA-like RNA helicase
VEREVTMLDARLPIYRYKQRIIHTVSKNAITLLMAETGAGKSTQVVKYLNQVFQVRGDR